MVVLLAFGLVAGALTLAGGGTESWLLLGYRAAYGMLWTTLGSVALGILLGLAVDMWAGRTKESGEGMTLVMGVILVAVGASQWLGLSPLFATLALGATVANTSHRGDFLLRSVGRADPPLFAAFFVLAGAELQVASLATIGATGLAYVVLRIAGKVVGARLGLRGQDVAEGVRRHLGLCLLSSSSLAIGLIIQVRSSFPHLAPALTGVVLAAVLIFEIVGPMLTRHALLRTDEAKTLPAPLAQATDPSLAP
jgi:Kef-type K+ transport system membrane component KefB